MSSQNSSNSLQNTGNNLRRKPANESVSLRQPVTSTLASSRLQRPQELIRNVSSGSSMEVDLTSEAPSKPAWNKDSSGESSNPDNWFQKSNNNVRKDQTTLRDGEPPFFLRRSSSSENTTPHITRQRAQKDVQPSTRSANQLELDPDSGSEDFRSVIDDLTIENQRLKRKLKKFERMRNSQLGSEALFELRVHGLGAQKKRELEDLLRDFVTKVGKASPSIANMSSSKNSGPSSLMPQQTSSSTSRIGDSGYHSLSASGNNSSRSGLRKVQPPTAVDLSNDIQNYLGDIPAGLLPQQTGPVSEKEKKKIVVRRLEQLFAGRDPSAGGHQQPIQQQKLAQSAARADRRATQISGDAMLEEGSRIARIMPKHNKDLLTTQAIQTNNLNQVDSSMAARAEENPVSETDTQVEQRPTRPLDLDPYRAQIPEDNMDYMRHLGFSPPHFDLEAEKDGHCWVYLNVLHNMAQLHLSSVTVDFVRKAVMENSQKLEISPDGRKIRWKGGSSVTITSSNNSPEHLDNPPQSKRNAQDGGYSANDASEQAGYFGTLKKHKFAYSPLFHRNASSASLSGAGASHTPNTAAAVTLDVGGEAIGGDDEQQDAPIIFYNNLEFYTDLSGDPTSSSRRLKNSYNQSAGKAIGDQKDTRYLAALQQLDSEKGPLSQLDLEAPQKGTASISSGSLELVGNSNSTPSSLSMYVDPVDLKVSGLGGVYPADNFSINVRSRQNHKTTSSNANTPQTVRRQAYPSQIRRMLHEPDLKDISHAKSSTQAHVHEHDHTFQREIMSSRKSELPASELPEGNYYHDESGDSDDEDTLDDDSEDSGYDAPANASDTQRKDWATGGLTFRHLESPESSECSEDDLSVVATHADDRSESRESIDLLAAARQVDPESIRVREREFDSNMAERFAEEIPPGSSAATAEGGSGFNSPDLIRLGATSNTAGVTVGHVTTTGAMKPPIARRPSGLKRQRHSGDSESDRARATKSPKLEGSQGAKA